MSVKKKLAATTLAVTVAATAFAGIPLSSKGLAEKLGFSNVAYAAVNSTLTTKIQAVHANLANDAAGKQKVQDVRDAIAALDYDNLSAELEAALDDVVSILDNKLATDISSAEREVLFDIVVALGGATYDPNLGAFENLFATGSASKDLLDRLANEVPGITAGISQAEVENYLIQVALPALNSQFINKTLQQVENSLSTPTGRDLFVASVLANVLDSADSSNVTKVLKHYFTVSDALTVKTILQTIQDEVDSIKGTGTSAAAFNALAKAYYGTVQQPPVNPPYVPPVTPPTDTWVDTIIDDLEEALEELIGDYEDADDEEKAEIIEKALELALEAAQQILTLKASDFISYVDGQAVITLNADSLKLHFEGIKAIQEALEPLDVELALPSLVIDLTGLSEDAVLDVVGELLQQALELGIPSVKFGFDGAYVLIPVNESFAKTLKAFIKRDSLQGTRLPIITKQLSKAYNVSVELDGEVVTHYGRAIKVILPLGSQAIDPDFTTVVKYTNGKLSYENGAYDANGNVITETTDHSGIFFAASRHASFPDISSVTSWAGLQIRSIVSKGIVEGRPDGSFDPQANVTRAEFAKMIVRALNLELTAVGQPFNDVEDDAWYAPYIAAGFAQNVFNGRTTTSFAPNATITRAEMAAMIARAVANAKGITLDDLDVAGQLGSFSDAGDVHETLREGVAFAAGLDLIIGNNGKFNPRNNATRAQAAVVIYRVLHLN